MFVNGEVKTTSTLEAEESKCWAEQRERAQEWEESPPHCVCNILSYKFQNNASERCRIFSYSDTRFRSSKLYSTKSVSFLVYPSLLWSHICTSPNHILYPKAFYKPYLLTFSSTPQERHWFTYLSLSCTSRTSVPPQSSSTSRIFSLSPLIK